MIGKTMRALNPARWLAGPPRLVRAAPEGYVREGIQVNRWQEATRPFLP